MRGGVHERGVVVADLLLDGPGSRLRRRRLLDDRPHVGARLVVELFGHAVGRLVRGDRKRVEPRAVGVREEVVARLHWRSSARRDPRRTSRRPARSRRAATRARRRRECAPPPRHPTVTMPAISAAMTSLPAHFALDAFPTCLIGFSLPPDVMVVSAPGLGPVVGRAHCGSMGERSRPDDRTRAVRRACRGPRGWRRRRRPGPPRAPGVRSTECSCSGRLAARAHHALPGLVHALHLLEVRAGDAAGGQHVHGNRRQVGAIAGERRERRPDARAFRAAPYAARSATTPDRPCAARGGRDRLPARPADRAAPGASDAPRRSGRPAPSPSTSAAAARTPRESMVSCVASTSTRPTTSAGCACANVRAITPPQLWPTSKYGGLIPDAASSFRRSATRSAAVRAGIAAFRRGPPPVVPNRPGPLGDRRRHGIPGLEGGGQTVLENDRHGAAAGDHGVEPGAADLYAPTFHGQFQGL